jgi:hypothetical protein
MAALAVVALATAGGALATRLLSSPPEPEVQLVFAEFGAKADRVFTAPADDPAQRTLITTVEHVEGWGLNPAIAPAGALVAYTVLPPGSRPQADSPAELWLLDVLAKSKQRLAGDADLRIAPILDRDGKWLVYRVSEPGARQSLMRVDLATGVRKPVVTIETAFGTFPVGFAADGSLVYASLSVEGTGMYRVAEGRPPVQLFRSDQITRDWRLSPDGTALAFLAPEIVAERVVNRLHIVRLDQANTQPVRSPQQSMPADQYGAAWTPDGNAVTVGLEAAPGAPAGAVTLPVAGGETTSLPAPPRGFDRPLEWSPDGRTLAARSFDGNSASAPGTETTVVVSTDGARRPVTGSGEIIVFGWIDAA